MLKKTGHQHFSRCRPRINKEKVASQRKQNCKWERTGFAILFKLNIHISKEAQELTSKLDQQKQCRLLEIRIHAIPSGGRKDRVLGLGSTFPKRKIIGWLQKPREMKLTTLTKKEISGLHWVKVPDFHLKQLGKLILRRKKKNIMPESRQLKDYVLLNSQRHPFTRSTKKIMVTGTLALVSSVVNIVCRQGLWWQGWRQS